MKALIGIGLCAALLGGCAALPGRDGPRECSQQLGQEQELQMNMVRDMIREGRLHAALANLESMPPGLLDVREERALILRRIGDPRARAEYQALLETCKAPEAHHGLGLLALRSGDSARAVLELREAARLRPTESRFRNDLGSPCSSAATVSARASNSSLRWSCSRVASCRRPTCSACCTCKATGKMRSA